RRCGTSRATRPSMGISASAMSICRTKTIGTGPSRSGNRYGTEIRMEAINKHRRRKAKSAPRMRKADRKRQLMQHAKQLFVTLGYQQTTTEKIARAAGVTEPVLYRHFTSKKALFLEVLDDIRETTIHRWQSETARIGDPLKRLYAIVDLYLGSTREHAVEF